MSPIVRDLEGIRLLRQRVLPGPQRPGVPQATHSGHQNLADPQIRNRLLVKYLRLRFAQKNIWHEIFPVHTAKKIFVATAVSKKIYDVPKTVFGEL
ncbi:MAG: hypothetical protein ACR2NP_04365 [Pirellulaceae bacterium]